MNILYGFENIFKISEWNFTEIEYRNIRIPNQLQYWFEMLLLVLRLCDSDDILMIDIQTDPS